jgi:hypothetical protein
LELADQLFASGPIDADKRNLQRHLRKASDLLAIGTVAAATEAAALIANAKNTYEQRLQQLEKVGYYDRDTFCLFWELWLLPIPLIPPCDSEGSRHPVPGEAATPSERSDAGDFSSFS